MRLTKDIKAEILSDAINKSGVPELEAAIRKRYVDWIETVRVRVITPEVEQAIDQAIGILNGIAKVSESYINDYTRPYLTVNVAGQKRQIYFNGNMGNKSPTPNIYKRTPSSYPTLTADDPLVQQLYDIDADSAEVAKRRESVTAAVNAYLNAATTVKALLKLWPECEPLIPAAVAPVGVNLPSVPVADLNRLVNLP